MRTPPRFSNPLWERNHVRVLISGVLTTALVAGALVFSHVQTDTYHQRLSRIDSELNQPLQLLNQDKVEWRTSQATFEDAIRATTNTQIAGLFAQALTEAGAAQRTWDRFKAIPVQFDGEQAQRDAIDSAITTHNAAGQQLGVAVLSPNPDPALGATLLADQLATATQLQNAFETLETQSYIPAVSDAIVQLETEAGEAGTTTLRAVALILLLGAALTVLGYRRAARRERASSRRRADAAQVAAENALDTQLQHALDMADTEARVFRVIGRALNPDGGQPTADFLMAESSIAPFSHVLDDPDGHVSRCGVLSANDCPAAKTGQELVFVDSRALDACPHLLDRDVIPGAAVCTPVSIAGRAIGVIHEPALLAGPAPAHRTRVLEIVARKAGERLGALRAFARSETQARTDPLTGLLNRRSLDAAVEQLVLGSVDYTLAFADLDHFKVLNDTYGHDVGDRALRLFCTVLQANVRPDDIVSRYGGEEFVVVLPRCTPAEAVPVLRRVQEALADTVRADGIPSFTVSMGVSSTYRGGTFEEILMMADGCLLHAKDEGRNRIVVAGVGEPIVGPSVADGAPRSGAGGDEHEIGRDAGEQTGEDAPHEDLGVAQLEGDLEELDHDVQDRPGGERQERDEQVVVHDGLADDRADEGGTAADDAEQTQLSPRGPVLVPGQGRHDAEALRGVV